MIEGWIVIPGWEKFQSRRDRRDPWIKDWIDQLDRDEHLSLTLAERGLIADIRRAYRRHNGQLRANILPGLIQARVRIDQIERLSNAGLLVIVAAKPPPLGGETAARAREEVEVEKEKDLSLNEGAKQERPISQNDKRLNLDTMLRDIPR